MIKTSISAIEQAANNTKNVCAYLIPNIYENEMDLTIEDFKFIPGILTFKADDEENPLFYDENIKLFSSIEQFTAEQFEKAINFLQPIMKNTQFNFFQINIDIFSMFSGKQTLASYDPIHSNMFKGSYVFFTTYHLIGKYIQFMTENKPLSLNEETVWVHEIIHLFDHNAVMQSMAYNTAHSEAEAAKYHLLGFRNEGIASLFYFLKNNANSIKTLEQAKSKFTQYFLTEIEAFKRLDNSTGVSMKVNNNKDLWYEAGPWLILDLFCMEFDSVCEELIERIVYFYENQSPMNDADILEIIQWSLHISPERFVHYGFELLKPVYLIN